MKKKSLLIALLSLTVAASCNLVLDIDRSKIPTDAGTDAASDAADAADAADTSDASDASTDDAADASTDAGD